MQKAKPRKEKNTNTRAILYVGTLASFTYQQLRIIADAIKTDGKTCLPVDEFAGLGHHRHFWSSLCCDWKSDRPRQHHFRRDLVRDGPVARHGLDGTGPWASASLDDTDPPSQRSTVRSAVPKRHIELQVVRTELAITDNCDYFLFI